MIAVTAAFGDPTRRAIYLMARESAGGVTAAEVSDRFSLHANVARHHLDKLAGGGYLDVTVERADGGGAGRLRPSVTGPRTRGCGCSSRPAVTTC